MVHAVNSQLSAEPSRLIAAKQLLSGLQQLLDALELRFDCATFVSRATEKFIGIFTKELAQPSQGYKEQDILACDSKLYILLPVYVDFILSKGRLPPDDEFSELVTESTSPRRHGKCSDGGGFDAPEKTPTSFEGADSSNSFRMTNELDFELPSMHVPLSADHLGEDMYDNLSLQSMFE